jgi:hypothetical protein
MEQHTTQGDDKHVLSKGIRGANGHRFEIFVNETGFYLIISNSQTLGSRLFKINIKKFPILESAVDDYIAKLGW